MESKMNTAVLVLTFNRLDYLKDVFAAIVKAKPSRLYLASDGPRDGKEGEREKITEIRNWMLKQITWDCNVKTRFLEKNSGGCGIGVSSAITWFFEHEEQGIILEDDCVPSQSFFSFCEKMLNHYKDDEGVYSIVGYNPAGCIKSRYDYEFASISHCWGWATWKNRWQKFTFEFNEDDVDIADNFSSRPEIQAYWRNIFKIMEPVNIWDYQWNFCIAKHRGLTIYPVKNLVSNIGEFGVHYTGGGIELHKKICELDIERFNNTKQVDYMNDVLWTNFFNLNTSTGNTKQTKIYLFNLFPLYKIKKKNNKTTHYLFGFLPLFKIKEK